uniref:Ig-like domain-containing protein n=1 Tax=Terrapene triunguis TaxID=2587831 RepID=A0A674J4C2_9SAUR
MGLAGRRLFHFQFLDPLWRNLTRPQQPGVVWEPAGRVRTGIGRGPRLTPHTPASRCPTETFLPPQPLSWAPASSRPEVGGDVSLAPQNLPQDVLVCSWYRSATTHESSRILTYYPPPAPDQIPGPAHTGRETAGPGCTLHIAGLTLSDTGNYTVLIQSRTGTNPVRSIRVVLRVSEMLPRPTVTPDQTQVLENGTFTLTCNSSPSADTVLWLRDGASLAPSERLGLSPENRTLMVPNVTRGDAGTYQCEVGNPVSSVRSEPSTVMVASLSAGAVAGILIWSLAGAALVGVGAYFLCE